MIALLLLALSIGCYSISQLAQHGKLKWMTVLEFYDYGFWGKYSNTRKYKNIAKGNRFIPEHPGNNWYYRFFKIKYKERFLFSTTFLINFTDGYHLCQSISFLSLAGCVSLLSGISFWYVWLGVLAVHAGVYRAFQK